MFNLKIIFSTFIFIFVCPTVFAVQKNPEAILEHKLEYKINYSSLENGNFQYFYALLKQVKTKKKDTFINLGQVNTTVQVSELLETFLPLDAKNLWDPKDNNYLAIAKFHYMLPISIEGISEQYFSSKEYLQKTTPRYKVTQNKDSFHIGGSILTPDFDIRLSFLSPDHQMIKLLKHVDINLMKKGKMKVSFMEQSNFGRVMFFRTAKMASALLIYQEHTPNLTLVTQYILSNVINVPTKSLIRKGMIENLQNVVKGSREAVKKLNY